MIPPLRNMFIWGDSIWSHLLYYTFMSSLEPWDTTGPACANSPTPAPPTVEKKVKQATRVCATNMRIIVSRYIGQHTFN